MQVWYSRRRMLWLIPALLAPLLWAASNLIDERLINRDVKHIIPLITFGSVFAVLPLVAVLITGRMGWPGVSSAALGLIAGALGLLVLIPYFRALHITAAPDVILMWNLTPILIAIVAHWTISERLMPVEYVAIALLVASSLLAAYRPRDKNHVSRAYPWMILASVMLAGAAILEKALYERVPFGNGLGWISLGSLITTVVLWILQPTAAWEVWSLTRRKIGRLLLGNEALDFAAGLSMTYATSLGPVSLVHSVDSIQPLLVLFFATLFGIREPHTHLEARRSRYVRTGFAVLLAALGLGLLRYTE